MEETPNTGPGCEARYLGRVGYERGLEIQRALVEARKTGAVPDQLLLLEHPHVITLGRRATGDHVLLTGEELRARGVAVHRTERGGEVTYHGPGQLVGYPIVDLRRWGGPADYVHALEEVIIRTVGRYGARAERVKGHPGVWVGGGKLAAIGVRVSGGVASHGFALNVHTDLAFFRMIIPCGVPGMDVTSLERLTGRGPALRTVAGDLARTFGLVLGRDTTWCEGLPGALGTPA